MLPSETRVSPVPFSGQAVFQKGTKYKGRFTKGKHERIDRKVQINGAETQNRTGDTGIFSPLLYRLSYLGTMAEPTGFEPAISGVTGRRVKPGYTTAPRLLYGGRNRARTCDPLLVRQVLSQLSYSPKAFNLKAKPSIPQ